MKGQRHAFQHICLTEPTEPTKFFELKVTVWSRLGTNPRWDDRSPGAMEGPGLTWYRVCPFLPCNRTCFCSSKSLFWDKACNITIIIHMEPRYSLAIRTTWNPVQPPRPVGLRTACPDASLRWYARQSCFFGAPDAGTSSIYRSRKTTNSGSG